MNQNVMLGLSNIGVAAFLLVMAVPLARRKVKMNRVYGIRIKKAFASDENWYRINEYGERTLIMWSLVLAAFGIATFFLPLGSGEQPNETAAIIVACAPVLILAPWTIQMFRFAKKV